VSQPSGEAFAKARADGRAALVGYLPAGFPSYAACVEAAKALVDGGTDVIEIGLPYSDPVLDGPTIQAATARALAAGIRTADVLRTVEAVAITGVATVVMTYWNPVLAYGPARFAADLVAAGGSGLITPDLTPDEGQEWIEVSDEQGLERIFLVAPSSTDARIASTTDACRGWIYAASTMGVTGARSATSAAAPVLVDRVRARSSLAVGVGLGVSNAAQAEEVASFADGVIVGSALVRCLLDAASEAEGVRAVAGLTAELSGGVRAAAGR
jgi:tryptophan synthase alpha chain